MSHQPLPVQEPFPIYLASSRYFLYDVNVISHVRRTHRMCGCLTGTLPQIPQQNIFLGLPLELMTEEALLLVEKGAGYIVDDVRAHKRGLEDMLEEDKKAYLAAREEDSRREAEAHVKAAEERKAAFARGRGEGEDGAAEAEETPFDGDPSTSPTIAARLSGLAYYSTPSTSHHTYHSLPPPGAEGAPPPPQRTPGYPLYRHLHENGYFLSPGLRFGCQYMAYPGDPLRFHSHFVVTGVGWDEEIDMLDVVGGGRLGTGVKKAWMVGGEDEEGKVRTFSVEWGGF